MKKISQSHNAYVCGGLNTLEVSVLCGAAAFILTSIGVYYAFPITWKKEADPSKIEKCFNQGFFDGNAPRVNKVFLKNQSYERGYTQGFKIGVATPSSISPDEL